MHDTTSNLNILSAQSGEFGSEDVFKAFKGRNGKSSDKLAIGRRLSGHQGEANGQVVA